MIPDLAFALELATRADEITLRHFRSEGLRVLKKPDLTPVSDADRETEEALREAIRAARPGDAILGEELGAETGAGARWILDPIDGTRNYVRGIPVFATLIALERDAELTLGVVSAPALRRRWWASRGEGAFADGEPIHVSGVHRIEDAAISYASAQGFERSPQFAGFLALAGRCWNARGFGDFWQHMLVAEGSVDVAVDPIVELWDLAAVKVIVEEAGGRFTDFAGAARADGGSAVSSNGFLHEEVLDVLGD